MLAIQGLTKIFPAPAGEVVALRDIRLEIGPGRLVTFIGPSGCGKSTLLKIAAGLDASYEGSITLDGRPIEGPSVEKGVIFQEPRLFPWWTVEKNIAANASLRDAAVRRRVGELIELVRLKGFEKAYPSELSGGMAQRVAIARALLRRPKVLLLDEPFGALDAFTRAHMQEVLLDIWQSDRTTMLFVTHDLDEAVFLGQQVVIMNPRPGHIRRVVSVDLPYPRQRTGAPFQEIRGVVLREFEKVEEAPVPDPGAGI
ncbi:ABC transporter ATP-binding protein [Paenibacillus sp. FSL W8-1187]|uniref:Alkanesulfonates ABC transporter ATP-binding protein n=1 Tax=Paenibacillus pasadenensis TaxID=217090 RepID=A0A2N5N268_9BACL|nr:ABC transporter ATP-binding protein [Paenibacillus pasadenensis]PLT44437.1 Alkanesulfonates ABC transporter ATP-binding protein [Paenibacillus pasadenensis]